MFHLDNSTTSGRIDEVLAVETFGPYVLVKLSASQCEAMRHHFFAMRLGFSCVWVLFSERRALKNAPRWVKDLHEGQDLH